MSVMDGVCRRGRGKGWGGAEPPSSGSRRRTKMLYYGQNCIEFAASVQIFGRRAPIGLRFSEATEAISDIFIDQLKKNCNVSHL